MKLTAKAKQLLIENHPDRHGGDHSRLGTFFAALKRRPSGKHDVRYCPHPGCGAPISGGAGKYCNIHWRAARRLQLAAACWLLLSPLLAAAQNVTLAWDASVTPGITNYVLYASTNAISLTNTTLLSTAQVRLHVSTNLTATVENLKAGQWTFAVTAMGGGIESAPTTLAVEVPKEPARMRTVVVQYSGTLTNFYDVGFFRLRLP